MYKRKCKFCKRNNIPTKERRTACVECSNFKAKLLMEARAEN